MWHGIHGIHGKCHPRIWSVGLRARLPNLAFVVFLSLSLSNVAWNLWCSQIWFYIYIITSNNNNKITSLYTSMWPGIYGWCMLWILQVGLRCRLCTLRVGLPSLALVFILYYYGYSCTQMCLWSSTLGLATAHISIVHSCVNKHSLFYSDFYLDALKL